MTPTIIFCADPLAPGQPDPAFAAEAAAAEQAGFAVALLAYERLVHEHNPAGAVRRLARQEHPTNCLYRGWMLSVASYAQLYAALIDRGYQLLHTPEVYRTCHELPASYPFIARHTPHTVWLAQEAGLGLDQIMAALAPFGDQPLIVKDYVKSRKHEWREACFIPSAADRQEVACVTDRFLVRRGGFGVASRQCRRVELRCRNWRSAAVFAGTNERHVLIGLLVVSAQR